MYCQHTNEPGPQSLAWLSDSPGGSQNGGGTASNEGAADSADGEGNGITDTTGQPDPAAESASQTESDDAQVSQDAANSWNSAVPGAGGGVEFSSGGGVDESGKSDGTISGAPSDGSPEGNSNDTPGPAIVETRAVDGTDDQQKVQDAQDAPGFWSGGSGAFLLGQGYTSNPFGLTSIPFGPAQQAAPSPGIQETSALDPTGAVAGLALGSVNSSDDAADPYDAGLAAMVGLQITGSDTNVVMGTYSDPTQQAPQQVSFQMYDDDYNAVAVPAYQGESTAPGDVTGSLVASAGTAQGGLSSGLVYDEDTQAGFTSAYGTRVNTYGDGSYIEVDPRTGNVLSAGDSLDTAPPALVYYSGNTHVEVAPDGSWRQLSPLGQVIASGSNVDDAPAPREQAAGATDAATTPAADVASRTMAGGRSRYGGALDTSGPVSGWSLNLAVLSGQPPTRYSSALDSFYVAGPGGTPVGTSPSDAGAPSIASEAASVNVVSSDGWRQLSSGVWLPAASGYPGYSASLPPDFEYFNFRGYGYPVSDPPPTEQTIEVAPLILGPAPPQPAPFPYEAESLATQIAAAKFTAPQTSSGAPGPDEPNPFLPGGALAGDAAAQTGDDKSMYTPSAPPEFAPPADPLGLITKAADAAPQDEPPNRDGEPDPASPLSIGAVVSAGWSVGLATVVTPALVPLAVNQAWSQLFPQDPSLPQVGVPYGGSTEMFWAGRDAAIATTPTVPDYSRLDGRILGSIRTAVGGAGAGWHNFGVQSLNAVVDVTAVPRYAAEWANLDPGFLDFLAGNSRGVLGELPELGGLANIAAGELAQHATQSSEWAQGAGKSVLRAIQGEIELWRGSEGIGPGGGFGPEVALEGGYAGVNKLAEPSSLVDSISLALRDGEEASAAEGEAAAGGGGVKPPPGGGGTGGPSVPQMKNQLFLKDLQVPGLSGQDLALARAEEALARFRAGTLDIPPGLTAGDLLQYRDLAVRAVAKAEGTAAGPMAKAVQEARIQLIDEILASGGP